MPRRPREARRRLPAEEARGQILDAAERRVREVGPDGLRLQELAADVGVSHPTILHHFGSRDGLVAAVVVRALDALERDLVDAFTGAAGAPSDVAALLDSVHHVMAERGQARLLAWLILGRDYDPRGHGSRLLDVARAAHAAREAAAGDPRAFEDTAFTVHLGSVTMFGAALLGKDILRLLELPPDDATLARFRRWLASKLLRLDDMAPAKKAARLPPRETSAPRRRKAAPGPEEPVERRAVRPSRRRAP